MAAVSTSAREWQGAPWNWARFGFERLALARGAVLFLASLGAYLAARSPSLDDWDSVNFVKAIGQFDMRLQQPHPPGYPGYIFLARQLNWFTREPQAALTLLSALSGAACVLVFYLLASDFGAGWAALPLAVMPLFWLNAEMAMSDVPGLLFAVAAVWLLNRALPRGQPGVHRGYLLAGCAAAGLGAGVRPQDAVVPLAVVGLYVAPLLLARLGRRALSELLLATGSFLGACLLWFVPLAISVEGDLRELWSPVGKQVDYVRVADSLVGQPLSPTTLLQRLSDYGSVFSGYFGGPFSGYFGEQMEGGFNAFLGLTVAVLLLTVAALLSGQRRLVWLAASWLVPYGVLTVLVMQPSDPRKVLPLLPAIILLLASAASRVKTLQTAGLLALAVAMAFKAVPLVHAVHTELTPPEQVAAYIAANYSPDDTVIFAGNSLNHLHYHLPQFTSLAIDFMTEDDMQRYVEVMPYRYALSLDEWQPTIPLPSDFVQVDSFDFRRDRLVLPKAWIVPFNVYERQPAS
jgi:hypothetical protein